MDRRTISINQAMEKCGVSRRTIYNWIKAKRIVFVRTPGGAVRIYEDCLLVEKERRDP